MKLVTTISKWVAPILVVTVLVVSVGSFQIQQAQATVCGFGSAWGVDGCRGYLTTADNTNLFTTSYYYVDAHTSISNPAPFTNPSNAFDGSTADFASFSGSAGNPNYLQGNGTNAAASGSSVASVQAQYYANSNAGGATCGVTMFTQSEAENLGNLSQNSADGWGATTTLSTPAAGWSWSVVDNLVAHITRFNQSAACNIYKIQIVVTAGGWTVPTDWNTASNTVEMIGAGGAGSGGSTNTGGGTAGIGGGGGAYTKLSNGAISGTVTFKVGVGAATSTAGGSGTSGGDTYWENTAASNVYASGGGCGNDGRTNCADSAGNSPFQVAGGGGVASTIGTPAVSFTVATSTGGTSSSGCSTTSNDGGCGGGGAAGVNGNGKTGAAVRSAATGGDGGSAASGGSAGVNAPSATGGAGGAAFDTTAGGTGSGSSASAGGNGSHGSGGGGGFGTAAGTKASSGGNGGAGIEYDSTHGSGGAGAGGGGNTGGGGGNASNWGGNGGGGGNYGGGGGGGGGAGKSASQNSTGGAGADGLIIISYTPAAAAGATTSKTGQSKLAVRQVIFYVRGVRLQVR